MYLSSLPQPDPSEHRPTVNADDLRVILGLKARAYRQRSGLSLSDLAAASGLSVSYLSEIESGQKFPKPEKLLRLAGALGVHYDELVSPHLKGELHALNGLFESGLLQAFPFELFGMKAGDLLGLFSHPERAAAFVQTFREIGRAYDLQVEQVFFAVLRSYQRLHSNFFPELEDAAAGYRRARGWGAREPLEDPLRRVLEAEHGYRIEPDGLARLPDLAALRSVLVPGRTPRLLLNPCLNSTQRAYVYGREIGFAELGVENPATTTPLLSVESFEQVLGSFNASYFAGALLLDGDALAASLESLFARPAWDPGSFLETMRASRATPGLFVHRLAEILPGRFGMARMYFGHYVHSIGSDRYELAKVLNTVGATLSPAMAASQHVCARLVTVQLLRDLDRILDEGWRPGPDPLMRAGRNLWLDGSEYFVVAAAEPQRLRDGHASAVALALQVDENFRARVRFWNDPAVPVRAVGPTCETCPLSPAECDLRRAPPTQLERTGHRQRQIEAVARLRKA